jgi:phosphatidylglycerophosphate synthase
MLRTPITPNHITTAGLLLSLLGAAGLAFGSYATQVLGVLLLWFCCILDGCDGEVARLKLMCSRSGGDYDLAADHVSHLAVFVAIPLAVRAADPGASILLPGALIVTGAAASAFSVWWLILRRPQEHPGPIQIFVERVASRDYVYLIAAFVVLRKLRWFLWAAAFGAHLFNLALWWLQLRAKASRD